MVSQIAGALAEADVAVLSMEAERKVRLAVEKKRTQAQNIHAVDAKQQTLQALAEEKKRQEARDLETHLTSAWLTEQHPGHADGPHRKRADAFKGKCLVFVYVMSGCGSAVMFQWCHSLRACECVCYTCRDSFPRIRILGWRNASYLR